jgi:hypothetical protein
LGHIARANGRLLHEQHRQAMRGGVVTIGVHRAP